jgi:sulfur carrier protein ThiS
MSNVTSIPVQLGRLTEGLKRCVVKAGTTLTEFLQKQELEYNSSVRVNGETAKEGTVLKAGDIVTVIDDVSGGR